MDTSLKSTWKQAWMSSDKRRLIITGTLSMLLVVFILPSFFAQIQKRKGVLLHDWVLAGIHPHNVSVFIFAIIWGMIALIMIRAIFNPVIYITYCWTLMFVCVTRLICIAIVPLAPPQGLIPLTDPLTGFFYGHASITKDLFFSGHTAVLTLIVLCLNTKIEKLIGTVAVIAVAFLLMVQHVHYTIDILAAPVIVYLLYRLTLYLLYRRKKQLQKQLFSKLASAA